ncbi:MAG: hypothetical protein CVU71_11835 [Deltaproteobacteria bacterium HGW-Deltaproteobacteria-6]|jgi:hypothetical protein|nr:MAG: hypothetical protein CVU71_11835 [Deltaproteobacteria bacterium HGW-Deltaproteobacteria-6]
MTLDEQIAELTRPGPDKMINLARPGVVVLASGLALAGLFTGNPAFYYIALVFTLIGFAIRQTAPHIRNAARGLREGNKQNGSVEISIRRWTDAESNQHESYEGLISMESRPLWRMEFVTPQNWQPLEGRHPAQLIFIRGVEWPVVILTGTGLLYPRFKPKRASDNQILGSR